MAQQKAIKTLDLETFIRSHFFEAKDINVEDKLTKITNDAKRFF